MSSIVVFSIYVFFLNRKLQYCFYIHTQIQTISMLNAELWLKNVVSLMIQIQSSAHLWRTPFFAALRDAETEISMLANRDAANVVTQSVQKLVIQEKTQVHDWDYVVRLNDTTSVLFSQNDNELDRWKYTWHSVEQHRSQEFHIFLIVWKWWPMRLAIACGYNHQSRENCNSIMIKKWNLRKFITFTRGIRKILYR